MRAAPIINNDIQRFRREQAPALPVKDAESA